MTAYLNKKNTFLRLFSTLIYASAFLYVITENSNTPLYLFISLLMIGSTYEIIKINDKYNVSIIKLITIIYVLSSFLLFIKMKNLDNGTLLILILIMQIWASDVGGYVIGKWLGKHKLSKISPQKTWEGLIGSLICCLIVGFFLKSITKSIIETHWAFIAILICASSISGDLMISKMKRINNKKNSGFFLPGHGGFLDRLDSLFLATIIYYFNI